MKQLLTMVLCFLGLFAANSIQFENEPLELEKNSIIDASIDLPAMAYAVPVVDITSIPVQDNALMGEDFSLIGKTTAYKFEHSPGMLSTHSWIRHKIKHDVPIEIGKPLPAIKNYRGFRQLKS